MQKHFLIKDKTGRSASVTHEFKTLCKYFGEETNYDGDFLDIWAPFANVNDEFENKDIKVIRTK